MEKKSKKGFTLLEIIVVIGLLVVIAGIFSLNIIKTLKRQETDANKNIEEQIIAAANAYVSMNPEAVEKLYNSYGYVDIPVGTLRDAGFLSEEIKNVETGENVSDDELVRVRFDVLDHLEYTYPADKGDTSDAWALIADNITITIGEYTGEDWCSVEENKYSGLIRNPSTDYGKYKSNLYLINNKPGEEQGRMYSGDYFATGEDGVNLRATSCNVNAKKIGTYNITYTYKDPETHIERSSNRTVFVRPDVNDISSFTAEFLTNPIVKGFSEDRVQVSIEETLLDGSKVKLPPIAVSELEKKGYKLTGFSTASVVTNKDATLEKVKANSDGSKPNPTTRKMKYTVYDNTYTLTFNGNGGTPSKTNMSVKYEEPYGTLATATRTGYTQNGWWTASSGGNEIKSTSIFRQVSNQTVYAHWTANEYTVTFNPNGSSVSPTSKTVTYDSTYGDLPTPSARTGYNFDGWYTAATGGTKITSGSKVTTAGNHTLYARWSAKAFRVTFNPNGGSVSTPYKTVYYEQSYGTLPTPTRTGYTFKGWYTSTSGGTKIESNTIYRLTDGQSLYAQWTINSYTVTINPNGGSYNGYTSSRSYSYNYNSTVTLSNPTRGGYTFNGWSKSGYGSLSSNRLTVGAGSTTLTANWRANTYTLYYSANGGRGSPTDRNIYAHWKEKTYTLYLYSNGSLYTSYSGLKNGQSLSGYLPSPSRSGYIFDGWYTGNSCSGSRMTNYSYFDKNNNYLYACFKQQGITLTLWGNGGYVYGESTYYETVPEGEYYTLPRPSGHKRGWSFTEWYDQDFNYNGMTYSAGRSYRFYSDTALTAMWSSGGSSGGDWDGGGSGGGGGGSSSNSCSSQTPTKTTYKDRPTGGWNCAASGLAGNCGSGAIKENCYFCCNGGCTASPLGKCS